MTKNLSRIVVGLVALASVFGVLSVAQAQDYTTDEPRGSTVQIDPATANNGALGFLDINPSASAEAIAAAAALDSSGGVGGGIAITGSESSIGTAIGIGLLALGGTALVASRKRDDE